MFVIEKNAYIKDLNEFSMYLFRWKGGGGLEGALMHVYVWEYEVSLYYRTA